MLHQCPVGIVECIGVDVPTHSTEDLTLTLKFGTFDVQDINVPKVDGVEVDLPEQLTFCKSTIKHILQRVLLSGSRPTAVNLMTKWLNPLK